ncbi:MULTISPECIES: hypothetical protein [Commensalibacter]|uniref:hypothetical protein n=1 Tax=Commensalibacter TaxID=1079922 RepID=UPI0012D92E2A|nr:MULTISPECIES: hypothetical protein [Commensalibacter]MCT6842533.1 hypothetical protein [Commensalibacter sp.]MBH9970708.1 hypothetical protein [Commensalibacter sp. M0265]MBH9978063.1 hypothetical protein [Commensalibacter sp. M0266]MBH9993721.1 hypothetical protein [Commensalibacter sp. M0270]MBI0047240.1 hypothetical protein [Commensalibacter sp. M0267]
MSKNILITFAGRQDRMENLNQYIRYALNNNLLDEWHIWDFTRNKTDKEYVRNNYGPIAYMQDNAGYQFYKDLPKNSKLTIPLRISNDLHIAFVEKNQDKFTEVVIGGWGNSGSEIRRVDSKNLYDNNRDNTEEIFKTEFFTLLNAYCDNILTISRGSDNDINISINGYEFPTFNLLNRDNIPKLYLQGGFGAWLEFCYVNDRIKQFIGNLNESYPYYHAYRYYASRIDLFKDDVFLKCDDDIVYIELEKLKEFIEFRRRNDEYFLLSANVVNNGVCAYFQKENLSIPDEVGEFELPPNGFKGSLWENGEKAEKLHSYFIKNRGKPLPLTSKIVEWDKRLSINFISWKGRDLRFMMLPFQCDDEQILTSNTPQYLNRKTALFSDFTVSHLSFYSQESHMNTELLINEYVKLRKEKYNI